MFSPGESGRERRSGVIRGKSGELRVESEEKKEKKMTTVKKHTDEYEKPVYDDSYDKKLNESYDRIKNRTAFSYDAKSDPLYAKYKSDYISQGRMAMKDTAGQASALSGGYSSSYAENLGQQQYDNYLTKLGDVLPELYRLAYSRYADEGDRLRDEFDRLEGLRDDEYRRYTDALDNYNMQMERAYQHQRDEKKDADTAVSVLNSEAAAKAKYGDFSGYAKLYGEQTAAQMQNYWISSNPKTAYNMGLIDHNQYYRMTGEYAPGFELPQPDSTASASGGYYPAVAPDGRDARTVQKELRALGYNIAVDGAWGPKSQAAWDRAYGQSGWISM